MIKSLPKRLYRSRDAYMLAGVCGGIGEYFNVDPTWIRLLFVLVFFLGGASLLVYIILWIIVPKKPKVVRMIDSDPEK